MAHGLFVLCNAWEMRKLILNSGFPELDALIISDQSDDALRWTPLFSCIEPGRAAQYFVDVEGQMVSEQGS